LAKACHYTLTLWEKLTRFLEYPELELSNMDQQGEADYAVRENNRLAGSPRLLACAVLIDVT
jgi:hypothetical protein